MRRTRGKLQSYMIITSMLAFFSGQCYGEVFLRVSPLNLVYGSVMAGVDFSVSERWTAGIVAEYMDQKLSSVSTKSDQIGGQFGYYARGVADDGLYLKVQILRGVKRLESAEKGMDVAYRLATTSAYGGYQWIASSGLLFNFGLGASVYKADVEQFQVSLASSRQQISRRMSQPKVAVDISVGYML